MTDRTLQSKELTDANDNRQKVAFDTLGMVVKTALMGKSGENVGDDLDHPTTEMVYSLINWRDNNEPNYVHTKMRKEHYLPGEIAADWQERYTYSGGLGQEILTKIQAEDGDAYERDGNGVLILPLNKVNTTNRWVGNGRTIINNKGKAVKQYEPYFSSTSDYEDESELREYGVTPVIHYDPLGRVIKTDMPDGTFTKVEFDCWTQWNYDQNDTVLDSTWLTDIPHYANYPTSGPDPLVEVTPPSDQQARAAWLAARHYNTPQIVHFDVMGRPFLTEDTLDDVDVVNYTVYKTTVTYDIRGNAVKVNSERNFDTTFEFAMISSAFATEEGETPIYTDSPDSGERFMLNSAAGLSIFSWDERGHTFENEYDANLRPEKTWMDDGSGKKLVNLLVYGEGQGNTLNHNNQVYLQKDQSGILTSVKYDFKGNLLQSEKKIVDDYINVIDWNVAVTMQKDLQNPPNDLVYTSSTSFDALNRPVSFTHPDGSVITPSYNKASLLESVTGTVRDGTTPGFIDNIDYDEKGQRVKIQYANDVDTTITYDPVTFRVTRIESFRTSDSKRLQGLDYIYDPVGNITYMNDDALATVYFNNQGATPTSKYEYDALYRLTEAEGRELTGLAMTSNNDFVNNLPVPNTNAAAMQTYTRAYTYDGVGNITKMQATGASAWTRNYYYDTTHNRLKGHTSGITDYTYDVHGNCLTMPHLQALIWDFRDRLKEVTLNMSGDKAYYLYDMNGERVKKVVIKSGVKEERTYLGDFEIYRKDDSSGTWDFERETVHVSDDRKRFALIDTKTREFNAPVNPFASIIRFQFDNHLGSACLELSTTGAIITYEEYHPFGTTSYRSGNTTAETSLKRYKYVGKERDEETGLYYYGARYYAAWIARFVSADPLEDVYPFQNPYTYASNNPIRWIDYNGEGPGDPVVYQSTEAKKGNVVIYLVDEGMDFGGSSTGSFNKDEWDVIAVTSLEHAKEVLDNVYGENSNAINNLVIRTHGDGAGEVYVESTTDGSKTESAYMDADDFSGKADTFYEKQQKDAFKGIFDHLNEDATVLLAACGCGLSTVPSAIFDLAVSNDDLSNIKLYTNSDFSSFTTSNDTTQFFRFDKELTLESSFNTGWNQITNNEKGEKVQTSLGEKVPVVNSKKGEIKFKQRTKTTTTTPSGSTKGKKAKAKTKKKTTKKP